MADDDLLSADKKVKLWRQFFSECLPADKEVKLWRQFFAECLLVYGGKNGKFKDLLDRAIDRTSLGPDKALLRAAMLKAIEDHEALRRPRESGSVDFGRAMAAGDETARAKWSKSYNESEVVLMYLALIDPVDARFPPELRLDKDAFPMDKREAIKRVAKAFHFPSFNACYQFLKRARVKGLPSTWPE